MATAAPVLVLCGRGTDPSAVTRALLAGSSRTTGDPATEADGTGPPLVAAVHTALLGAMDRDWTCPPATVEVDDGAVEVLAAMHRQVVADGGDWLVVDPDTTFLLPAWTRVAPRLHLVGVVGDHDDAVRGLARHGLARAEADDLVRAHDQRLVALAADLDFPLVDLGASSDEREEAVRRAREASTRPGLAAEAVDAADAAAAASHPPLVRSVGPQAARRRAAAWSAVPPGLAPAVEVCRRARVAVDRAVEPEGAAVVEAGDLAAVHTGMVAAREALGGPPAAIVLSDALAWARADDLAGLFRLVHAHLDAVGLVVLARSRGDVEEAVARGHGGRDDQVVAAATAAGLALVDDADGADGARRWRFVVDLPTTRREEAVAARAAPGGRVVHVADLPDGSPPGAVPVAPAALHLQATGPIGDWQRRYEELRDRRSVAATLRAVDLARGAAARAADVRARWRRG